MEWTECILQCFNTLASTLVYIIKIKLYIVCAVFIFIFAVVLLSLIMDY